MTKPLDNSPSPPLNLRGGRGELKKDSGWIAYGTYGAVGFQLAATVVGGLYVGNVIDQKLGTGPWIAVAGLTLGAIGGFYNLIRIMSWKAKREN